jgi:hypothetical protein
MLDPQKMTVVVSGYRADLTWLKEIPWNYVVYDKGENNLPGWIKNVIKLPNVGRESHTYLTHIVGNYDNLSDHTIFVQDNPFDHSKELIRKIKNFNGECDFFALSDNIVCCNKYGVPGHSGLKVGESASKFFLDNIEFFEFPAGAEFIVSRKAMLFHSKMTYQKLIDLMMEGVPYEEKRDPSSCRPFSPWVLERFWKTLFDMEHKTIYD